MSDKCENCEHREAHKRLDHLMEFLQMHKYTPSKHDGSNGDDIELGDFDLVDQTLRGKKWIKAR
jgi:hypothetical protein